MSNLSELRNEIDKIDDELLTLLEKRMLLSLEVRKTKELENIAVLDNKREDFIKDKIKAFPCDKAINEKMLLIYDTILTTSKDLQK